MSFQIISQNLVQYKAWLDDVQRLRTVTSLDVSAVAGHHAMPAALLFSFLLQLLWVLMWSTILGLVLQLLAARLGCVTGTD